MFTSEHNLSIFIDPLAITATINAQLQGIGSISKWPLGCHALVVCAATYLREPIAEDMRNHNS
jgi:hypothetical protein